MTDVVVPTLNSRSHLKRCLDSILREIPHVRLIVVDGGSSDGTTQLAKTYGALVLAQERPGMGEARRIGLAAVSSPMMAMVDSDVALPSGWFNRLNRKLCDDDHAAAASGHVIFGDPGCQPLAKYYEWRRTHHEWTAGLSNALIKTALVRRVGGFNPEYQTGEDFDLLMRILKNGFHWIMVDEVTVGHPRTFLEDLAHVWWWASHSPHLVILGPKAAARHFWYLLSIGLILAPVDLNSVWMMPLRCLVWIMGYIKQLTSIRGRRQTT